MIETIGAQAATGFTFLFLSFVLMAIGAIHSIENPDLLANTPKGGHRQPVYLPVKVK